MTKAQARRKDIVSFILSYTQKTGISPTIREIAQAVGLKSPSAVKYHLDILEKQGYIFFSHKKNRSLEVLASAKNKGIPVKTIPGDFEAYIPAGEFPYPAENFYAVHVPDNAMAHVGILENDIAIVCKNVPVQYGDIVHAESGGSAAVRFLTQRQGVPCLSVQIPAQGDIFSDSIKIFGKIVGIQRFYEN